MKRVRPGLRLPIWVAVALALLQPVGGSLPKRTPVPAAPVSAPISISIRRSVAKPIMSRKLSTSGFFRRGRGCSSCGRSAEFSKLDRANRRCPPVACSLQRYGERASRASGFPPLRLPLVSSISRPRDPWQTDYLRKSFKCLKKFCNLYQSRRDPDSVDMRWKRICDRISRTRLS